ncbi:hypothetical protein J6590_010702 [Homalodisca vitripennis]|nr:hypothetical protein J6590_010702 [Homalodisca vitripennis]
MAELGIEPRSRQVQSWDRLVAPVSSLTSVEVLERRMMSPSSVSSRLAGRPSHPKSRLLRVLLIRMNLRTYKLSLYVSDNMWREWGSIPIQPHLLLMTSVAQHALPMFRGLNTPLRRCRWLNTPVRRGTGGSTRPSGVPRAQHAHAGVSGAQHARPTRYRGLNTPIRCPAGSTRPCGGVGGSTRPSDEVPGAQHAHPVTRGLSTPMRGCRGLNTPVSQGISCHFLNFGFGYKEHRGEHPLI